MSLIRLHIQVCETIMVSISKCENRLTLQNYSIHKYQMDIEYSSELYERKKDCLMINFLTFFYILMRLNPIMK